MNEEAAFTARRTSVMSPFKSFWRSVMARQAGLRRRRLRSSPRLESLGGRIVLSTFRVNTTLDAVAVDLRSGRDATGHISLRSAIMAANAQPGADTILLPNGLYKLTIAGGGENG